MRRPGQRLDFLRPRFAFRFVFFIAFFLPRFFVFFVGRFLAAFFLAAGLVDASGGEHCVDWEMNLLPDPSFRHLLAADESKLNDRSERSEPAEDDDSDADYGDDLIERK